MTQTFCEVINGEITKYNISRPRRWGNISFGTNATDEEYIAAGLYPVVGEAPAFDQVTQRIDGPVYSVNGQQVDRVYTARTLNEDEIAAIEADRVTSLWQAATDYEQYYIANMAVGLLTMGVIQQKPKAQAIAAWSYTLWNGPDGYYARKANGSTNYDYSNIGPMPYSIPELSEEVYGA